MSIRFSSRRNHLEPREYFPRRGEAALDFHLDLIDSRGGSVEVVGNGDDDVGSIVDGGRPVAAQVSTGVISKTILEVFGEVAMWRNNFVPSEEKVALIARRKTAPLPVPAGGNRDAMLGAVRGLHWSQTVPDMMRAEPESMPFFYAGNLSAARRL